MYLQFFFSFNGTIFNLYRHEVRRKSILKVTKAQTTPKPIINPEVILEKAIETTLNFLQPQRRFYARERVLKQAYK